MTPDKIKLAAPLVARLETLARIWHLPHPPQGGSGITELRLEVETTEGLLSVTIDGTELPDILSLLERRARGKLERLGVSFPSPPPPPPPPYDRVIDDLPSNMPSPPPGDPSYLIEHMGLETQGLRLACQGALDRLNRLRVAPDDVASARSLLSKALAAKPRTKKD